MARGVDTTPQVEKKRWNILIEPVDLSQSPKRQPKWAWAHGWVDERAFTGKKRATDRYIEVWIAESQAAEPGHTLVTLVGEKKPDWIAVPSVYVYPQTL